MNFKDRKLTNKIMTVEVVTGTIFGITFFSPKYNKS